MIWNDDLWNEMDRIRKEMTGLLSDYGRSGRSTTYPLVNIYENNENIIVTAELPGMTKDKVKITFADGVLTLSGNLEPLGSVRKMNVVRQERSSGAFDKTIRIPTKIIPENINASFSNGILTVTLPKSEEVKPKTIQITAQ